MERLDVFGGVEQIADAADEFLGLKRFAHELVGLDSDGAIGDGFVDYAGHENDGSFGELRILFDLAADGVAILIGHDDIRDDDIGRMLFELVERGGGVGAGDDKNIFAAKGDLDDFAHGGAVIDEIDGRGLLGLGRTERGHRSGFAHRASLSAS